jgi:hypothetical protein
LVKGEITLPAAPGMIDEYVSMCETLFAGVGRAFTAEQIAQVRNVLEGQLAEAYANSPRSNIVITFDAPVGTVLNYHVRAEWWTVGGRLRALDQHAQATTVRHRTGCPRVEFGDRSGRCHNVSGARYGGGTGRNTLALARRGHPVEVVEMTPKFADFIRADAERESLNVRVIQRDVFSTSDDLRRDYRLILLSEVVSDFRSTRQLRAVFELATQCLAAEGRLVFNIFLPKSGYTPDGAALELGQQCYTTIFMPQQVSAAASGLPLQLVANDSVYEYEKSHLPEGAWPPTSWYADWVSGRDVFDLPREECPIEMRWLVYQKPAW